MTVRSRHISKSLTALLVGGAFAFATLGVAQAAVPTLYVTYALKCTFTMTDDSGKTVTSIPAGAYQVQVSTPGSFGGMDLSGISDLTACMGAADFQITGPGVNLHTSLNDGDGSQDVLQATFQPNASYVAVDNNNPVTRTTFTTTAASAGAGSTGSTGGTSSGGATTTTKTATPATPATLKGTLTGAVTAAGKATLTYKHKALTTLAPGLYKVTVNDKSKKVGLILQMQHGKTTTVSTGPGVGTKTVTVNLKAGQWFFYTAKGATKSGFIVSAGLYG
jgi:hypothetical protein